MWRASSRATTATPMTMFVTSPLDMAGILSEAGEAIAGMNDPRRTTSTTRQARATAVLCEH
jgi:hypothetical protein